MAEVKLQVQVVREPLDKLIADVEKIKISPIEIKIDGVEGTLKDLSKIVTGYEKISKSASEVAVQQEKTKQAVEKRTTAEQSLLIQIEKTATAETNLRTQQEKTATAQANRILQTEKTKTAEANLATQVEKTKTAELGLETQVEKTATAALNYETQLEKTNTALAKHGDESEEASKKVGLLEKAWIKVKDLAIQSIIFGIRNAFKEALNTMKAVDDELVVVRKVTGASAEELEKIEKQAYKTATAYGVSASAYLESVAAFTRAGYKEQAEDLAELSTKTQIVGDTNAETANQFLLSVDAAYKYNGSIAALSSS